MDKKTRTKGPDFVLTLTLIFVVLKLTGAVSWPWVWVLSPLWISLAFCVAAFSSILVAGRIVKGKW